MSFEPKWDGFRAMVRTEEASAVRSRRGRNITAVLRSLRRSVRARLRGVVAKNHSSFYRPNDRGWVKVKNPNYWRRDAEREAMTRKHKWRAPWRRSCGGMA
jgi:ATP-dependent DNA ligase